MLRFAKPDNPVSLGQKLWIAQNKFPIEFDTNLQLPQVQESSRDIGTSKLNTTTHAP
jgi:hypothetical protein